MRPEAEAAEQLHRLADLEDAGGAQDPEGAVDMFEIVERQREVTGAAVPEWQSTHPDPGNRVLAAEQRISTSGIEGGIVRRDEYLRRIDGMM